MVKEIGQIYNHGQSQLSNQVIKAPAILSVASQTSSSIELIIASVSSGIDKKNSVLCSKNSIQNDATITNNDDI